MASTNKAMNSVLKVFMFQFLDLRKGKTLYGVICYIMRSFWANFNIF